jgi:hypothetical protein
VSTFAPESIHLVELFAVCEVISKDLFSLLDRTEGDVGHARVEHLCGIDGDVVAGLAGVIA